MEGNDRYAIRFARGRNLELPDHPRSCGLADLREYARGLDGPLAIDLFCGAGGTSLGLEQAGFQVILGVDSDKPSVNTHRANFGGCSLEADLSSPDVIDRIVEALDGIDIDLVAASPPCQPFSRAGRSKIRWLAQNGDRAEDERRELWRSLIHVVDRLGPRAVLVENVPGMTQGDDILMVAGIFEQIESMDFDVYARLLSAKQHRVPQFRERVFIVGVEHGLAYGWPSPDEQTTTVRDAISDLPPVEGGTGAEFCEYGEPGTDFQRWARNGMEGNDRHRVYDHFTRAVREDDLAAFRLMDHKTRYSDLPEDLRRYRSDIFDDKYKRLAWNDVSRTITAHIAKDGYWYIHPEQHRTLTVREAARLQTFPDRFRFAGFQTNAFRQIGNAVPPLLGAAVGRQILGALRNPERRRRHVSSRELSTVLATWMETQEDDELAQPWRRSDDLWLTLLGMVLFEKAKPTVTRNFWRTYARRWNTPQAYLEDPRREAATRAIGRSGANKLLSHIASGLTEPGDTLQSRDLKVPGLSRERMAHAATLSGSGRSFQPTRQTSRIARRVFGENTRDSKTEEQLALVRMIGDLTHSGQAFGALLEVGDRFCVPAEPRCYACPLGGVCATGQERTSKAHPALFSGHE